MVGQRSTGCGGARVQLRAARFDHPVPTVPDRDAADSPSHTAVGPIRDGRPALLANSQSAVFSPFSLPAYVLPFWHSLALIEMLKVFVAALGAFVFGRSLGMRFVGALAAGTIFGFSQAMVTWVSWPHTSSWALLPWLLVLVDRLLHRPDVPVVAGLAVLVALAYLGPPRVELRRHRGGRGVVCVQAPAARRDVEVHAGAGAGVWDGAGRRNMPGRRDPRPLPGAAPFLVGLRRARAAPRAASRHALPEGPLHAGSAGAPHAARCRAIPGPARLRTLLLHRRPEPAPGGRGGRHAPACRPARLRGRGRGREYWPSPASSRSSARLRLCADRRRWTSSTSSWSSASRCSPALASTTSPGGSRPCRAGGLGLPR